MHLKIVNTTDDAHSVYVHTTQLYLIDDGPLFKVQKCTGLYDVTWMA